MTVAKVLEISSESKKSFEHAISKGIRRVSKTVKGIESAWVKGQQVVVHEGEVVGYRVLMKITFVIDD